MNVQDHSLMLRQPLREVRLSGPVRDLRLAGDPIFAGVDPIEEKLREREQSGYERGRKEILERLEQERKAFMESKLGVLEALRQSVPKVVQECEQTLAVLCLEAANKLVSGIAISPELIEAAVKEALSQVEEAADLEIYLHAEDLRMLQGANSHLLAQTSNGPKLHFQASEDVTRGGCLVKTRFGIIDGRRETRFELLKKSVLS